MFIVIIRTVILYIFVIFAMRLMGKRQIGELQPYELAITIMISELASLPMANMGIPILHGILPIMTLLILEILFSLLELKSETASSILCGKPSILINKGYIDINELKQQKLNINDLMEELRLAGYFNFSDIQYAILETSGKISIIPKTGRTYVTKKDLNIEYNQEEIPVTLILDGNINFHNLSIINKDTDWLVSELNKRNISSHKNVFIALLETDGSLYCQCKKGGN